MNTKFLSIGDIVEDPNSGSKFLVISTDGGNIKLIDNNFNKMLVPFKYMSQYKFIDSIKENLEYILGCLM